VSELRREVLAAYAGEETMAEALRHYGVVTVKPLGRGRRRTTEILLSDVRPFHVGDVVELDGERLRIMDIRQR
jgi:hypothetical protein